VTDHYTLHMGSDTECDYLATTWTESGDVELAVRPRGGHHWGPPITLQPVPVEQVTR
jgi:hypothetical protein